MHAALEVTVDADPPGRTSRQISPHQLPQAARDRGIGEEAPIRQGVRELEALISMGWPVNLSPPESDVLAMMREQHELGNDVIITSLHWRVHVPRLQGVLDHIRTRLTQFVAEVRAAMPPGQRNLNSYQIVSAAQHALNIFHITAPHARVEGGRTVEGDPILARLLLWLDEQAQQNPSHYADVNRFVEEQQLHDEDASVLAFELEQRDLVQVARTVGGTPDVHITGGAAP